MVFISKIFLVAAGSVFALLSVKSLTDPVSQLKRHGIDAAPPPPSGIAELRCYFGPLFTLAWLMLWGAGGDAAARCRALVITASVLGAIFVARACSFVVDGAPSAHAQAVAAVEFALACCALLLRWCEAPPKRD
jgi:hypothetical protein